MKHQYTGTNGKTFTVEVTAEQAEVMIDIDRKFDSNERKFRARATKEASLDYLNDEYEWEPQDNDLTAEERLIDEETAAEEIVRLYKAIAGLSGKRQLLVRLYYFEQKTQEEIAAILGVTQQAVAGQIETLEKKLKELF